MNDVWASVIGLLLCCGVPILTFVAGAYWAKHGSPVEIRWRGRNSIEDED
jgi:hypothetical protein